MTNQQGRCLKPVEAELINEGEPMRSDKVTADE